MIVKPSTIAIFKKHGIRLDRTLHNYIYFVFYYPYVFVIYHIFKFLATNFTWFTPLRHFLKFAFERYHSKILSFSDTKKILELNRDISHINDSNRKIIPYKYANKRIFTQPDFIVVMDCPCKKTMGDEPWTINSCIAVGNPVATFWREHGRKYNARKITQHEALELIKNFRKHGYLTQAFFKVATGGSTGVICNCHPKSCVSLRATQFAKRFDSSLSMNAPAGYAVIRNDGLCKYCGDCARICPFNAIQVSDNKWEYNHVLCAGCELCVEHCTNSALTLVIDETKPRPLDIEKLSL
jgi:ferredoxin